MYSQRNDSSETNKISIVLQTKLAIHTFNKEILPALNNKEMTVELSAKLKQVSHSFEAFNQQMLKAGKEERAKYQELMQAIQKAAVLMINTIPIQRKQSY